MSKDLATTEANQLANVSEAELAFLSAADKCTEVSGMASSALKSIKIAKGMSDLRKAIEHAEIKELILSLANNSLGFLTDKDPNKPVWNSKKNGYENPKPYHESKILDCALEAIAAGALQISFI